MRCGVGDLFSELCSSKKPVKDTLRERLTQRANYLLDLLQYFS